jgi:hypothetical protein
MFADQTDLNCGDAFFFQVMTEPANGARAGWSDRDQHCGVDVILPEQSGQTARCRFHDPGVGGAHE